MKPFILGECLNNVRATTPLIHSITNYVTVNDCANVLLACGASPIMSDEPADVEDITSICGGLVLNIGTLNQHTIEGMHVAGKRAAELGHPIVLDPVGAGASALRTQTAADLLNALPITVIRGNMSEIKALAGASVAANNIFTNLNNVSDDSAAAQQTNLTATRGVDVNPIDVVTEDNLQAAASFARSLAAQTGAIVAITGAIDIVSDTTRTIAIKNGTPLMGKITGAGCMLTCVVAAYVVANPENSLEAAVAAVAGEGLAGEIAAKRMAADPLAGNASFRTYLIDAMYNMTADQLEQGALIQEL